MNQEKIGKLIAEKRKENSLTQLQLAEQLNVTDRAVSKWETGRAMPDSSIMLSLCKILKISVTDLLNGEVVLVDNSEEKILELIKEKENADKRLLSLEIFMGVICMAIFFVLVIIASLITMEEWLRVVLILVGLAPILIAAPFMLKIEQVAGYYQCKECGHKYVPTYKAVNLAMHMGRTRYMRCPECHKKSWQKKVISK